MKMDRFNSKSVLVKHDHLTFASEIRNSSVEDLDSSGYETHSSADDDIDSSPGVDFPADVKFSSDVEFAAANSDRISACIQSHTKAGCEKMIYKSESGVLDSLRYIITVPDMCDITFLVGPDQMPVNGVKAILAARSRFIFQMILRKQKELKKIKRSCNSRMKTLTRKLTNRTSSASLERITIPIENHEFRAFKQFIYFLHCGTVSVDSFNFIGLFCAASEFDIKDLRRACWDYTQRLIRSGQSENVLKMCSDSFYCDRQAVKYLTEKIRCFQK